MNPPPKVDDPATQAVPSAAPGALVARRLAAALYHRNFRILWTGAFTSTVGTWMQNVAQDWLVFTLTGSTTFLGLNTFLAQVPFLVFTPLAGVVADRHSRRHLLMGSQYVQMTCAFALAALVYWNVVEAWHILALAFVAGIAQAFGGPAYQSLIPTLVPKSDLPNALALNSIQFNLARVLGPSIATPTLATLGMAACFAFNGVSFLVVITALMMLSLPPTPAAQRKALIDEFKGGLAYVRHEPSLLALMFLAFSGTFLALPVQTLLPVFVQNIFHQQAGGLARMVTFAGAGAVAGALGVAWMGRFPNMGRTLLIGQLVVAVLIATFAWSRTLPLSWLLLALIGTSNIIVFSLTTSLVQLIAPDEMRGRVMSIYMLAFRGGMPLGALAAGTLAEWLSAPVVLTMNGALLFLVASVVLLRRTNIDHRAHA